MSLTAVLMILAAETAALPAHGMKYFPGPAFDGRVREILQRQVLASWPGPGELERMWREEKLSTDQRVALLIGGAAFHDPMLLPVYADAARAPEQRIRQAAAFGFQDLLADGTPDVTGGIDDEAADRLVATIERFRAVLRVHSLAALWVQSTLAAEGRSLPGWQGVAVPRSRNHCLRSLDRIVDPHDLPLLVEGYQTSRDKATRIGLLKLIQAVSLSRFLEKPSGPRQGWGEWVYETGEEKFRAALENWTTDGCTIDPEAVMRRNLEALGVPPIDPFGTRTFELWFAILVHGDPSWWKVAGQRLYEYGMPWFEFSALHPESEQNRAHRDLLLEWFTPQGADRRSRGSRPQR